MLEQIPSFVRSVAVPRAVLLANHVVAAEPAAVLRLKPMAGRRIDFRLAELPAPLAWAGRGLFDLSLRITAAGLFDWVEAPEGVADLTVTLEAPNPLAAGLQMAGGERPPVRIEGDAALAAEVNWLLLNLRWDLEDDLARVVGPLPARELARLGRLVQPAVAKFAAAAADLVARLGPRPSGSASAADAAGPAPGQGPAPR